MVAITKICVCLKSHRTVHSKEKKRENFTVIKNLKVRPESEQREDKWLQGHLAPVCLILNDLPKQGS